MKPSFCFSVIGLLLFSPLLAAAQTAATQPPAPAPAFTANYPNTLAGVFIQNPDWTEMSGVAPTKSKAKHGLAASLSYGAVPATVVAEYAGPHAKTQVKPGQPVFCLCHLLSLPGDPVIVKLHTKKESRELDGGKMIVYPIVGGNKMVDASKSDLVSVDVAHPDPHVWLVRPQGELSAGEYALMMGTQNMNIFPFTVSPPAVSAPGEDPGEKK